ncbi:MAG: helix-turn-helix transcriptional regulator [Phycisphaerales bacterium]|nr:helix-turn-helix transcriptional regulator [Phycisphaerales bacterium]
MTTLTRSPLHNRLEHAVGDRTYRQVADLTGVHAENVRRYMQGQAPSLAFVVAFCRSLGISADWLLTGQGPMLAADVRGHALRSAGPTDLLGAMADRLENMRGRLERVELYVQTLETRVRGEAAAAAVEAKPQQSEDGAARAATDDSRADRIAGAIAQRPPAPSDRTAPPDGA